MRTKTIESSRLRVTDDISQLVGETPILQLKKLVPVDAASVFAKLEYLNPGGSVKDRAASGIILRAEEEGRLKPGLTSIDVLRAAFPAGTVSGAPKVRAMEIIDELEPSRRGIYSGAVGYISFQDDMDTCIALRSAIVKDGVLYAQAGGGIVHDSSPEGEWQETLNKLRALQRAADMVQLGLDAEA